MTVLAYEDDRTLMERLLHFHRCTECHGVVSCRKEECAGPIKRLVASLCKRCRKQEDHDDSDYEE